MVVGIILAIGFLLFIGYCVGGKVKEWSIVAVIWLVLLALYAGIIAAGFAISPIGGIAAIGIVIYCICSTFSSTKSNGVKRTKRGFWVNINDVKMDSPEAQKVFNYYKDICLNKKIKLDEILRDVDLRREYQKIQKIQDSLPDDNDMSYILGFDLFGGADSSGFILNPQEEALFRTKSAEIKTVQRIAINMNYADFRVGDSGFRMGNRTIYPRNVEGLKHFADGDILVTNQRIIFKGDMKTKTISLGSIIGVENFESDGVIIFMSDRVNPIVIKFLADRQFFYNEKAELASFHNDLNDFYYALEKAMYQRLVPKEIQEMRKETDEINFKLARAAMIAEGLEKEEA